MTDARFPGFYWIKLYDNVWEPAQWDDGIWYALGSDWPAKPEEVGPRILPPTNSQEGSTN